MSSDENPNEADRPASQEELSEAVTESLDANALPVEHQPNGRVELSDNARVIMERRYLRKDEDGVLETPEDLFHRVAHAIAQGGERGCPQTLGAPLLQPAIFAKVPA